MSARKKVRVSMDTLHTIEIEGKEVSGVDVEDFPNYFFSLEGDMYSLRARIPKGLKLSKGSFVITNLTGGSATAVEILGTEMFAERPMGAAFTSTATGTLPVGDKMLSTVLGTVGTWTSGTMVISYLDPVGLNQTATITCQGATVILA